jgi:hypothetical protein
MEVAKEKLDVMYRSRKQRRRGLKFCSKRERKRLRRGRPDLVSG